MIYYHIIVDYNATYKVGIRIWVVSQKNIASNLINECIKTKHKEMISIERTFQRFFRLKKSKRQP